MYHENNPNVVNGREFHEQFYSDHSVGETDWFGAHVREISGEMDE